MSGQAGEQLLDVDFDDERHVDIAAEQSLLGACMESAVVVEQVAGILCRPTDFYRPAHQEVFRALLILAMRGDPTDPVTVKNAMAEQGTLRALGDRPELALFDLYGRALVTSAAKHADIVAGYARTRRLRQAAKRFLQQSGGVEGSVDEALADFEAEAAALRQGVQTTQTEPDFIRLDAFLSVEDPPVAMRIERLMPVGARALLTAAYKSGKTTAMGNLLRALADKEAFLGVFDVEPPASRIVLIDNELDASMMRRWLRDHGIVNTDRISVLSLRGRVGTFNLLDPATRSRWARKLANIGASLVIFDCLRPVLDALGLSEDKEAGRFLVQFDALLTEAGASEAVLVHHMGHTAERSRGDSRLQDWPDVTWRLVRERGEDGEAAPDARRYFSAYGRDVDVPEGLLSYDPASRRLTLSGGNRRETAADGIIPDIVDFVTGDPGASGRSIEAAMVERGHAQKAIRAALRRAVDRGEIDTSPGKGRAVLHFLPEESASDASAVRQRAAGECVSASIGDAHAHTPPGQDHGSAHLTHLELHPDHPGGSGEQALLRVEHNVELAMALLDDLSIPVEITAEDALARIAELGATSPGLDVLLIALRARQGLYRGVPCRICGLPCHEGRPAHQRCAEAEPAEQEQQP